jgi:hypothetical protein
MGLFDSFRTGRTAAKKASAAATEEAKRLGEEQLGLQEQYGQQISDLTMPGIQQGQAAIGQLGSYYNSPEGQQQFVNQAQQSPLYGSMVNQGEQAIARNASATGGVRGGAIQESLASNSQNVLNSIINQRLQGLGGMADYGMANQSSFLNAFGQNIAGQGQTRAGIAGADFSNAANLSNQASGMMNLYGGLIGGGASALGSYLGKPA